MRCSCNGKLAKNSRCGMGTKRKSSKKKASAKSSCKAGTLKMKRMGSAGKRCVCKTRTGGTKIVKTSRCK